MKNVTLYLENGSRFCGKSFGYEKPVTGEVVFTSAMSGYPETLTDPATEGEMIVFTYPLIGNAGVPPHSTDANGLLQFFEGEKIYASALIVSDYSEEYSHWNACESLGAWLQREKVAGITGIDTRELTEQLRENGTMTGRIVFEEEKKEIDRLDFLHPDLNRVERVSCRKEIRYNGEAGRKRVLLVDCGVRYGIIRCLLKYNLEVIRVPWNTDFTKMEYDGICIAGGPGDPYHCGETVKHLRSVMDGEKNIPILGIGIGCLLLGRAAGATVYRLKFGHHGHNQPVKCIESNRCYITTQFHNFAVDADTLNRDWRPLFININDGSNEGFCHAEKPWKGIQFHTESEKVKTDTQFLFEDFVKSL